MIHSAGVHVVVELLLVVHHDLVDLTRQIQVGIGHHVDMACRRGAHGGGGASDRAVVGVEVDVVEPGIIGGLDEQRQVRTPVAGDHGVGTRLLDLGNVGREVAHLGQRRKVVTHDLHIRALALEHFLGVFGNLVSVRVVLVDQVDLLDFRLVFHESGQRFHFHGSVCIQTEVPVAALAVGEIRVNGRIVEEQDFFARIARVVFFQRVHDGKGRA
ncbi:hypothetical protein D3C71_1487670 [compost metagenome]